jgi:hypothetical protein
MTDNSLLTDMPLAGEVVASEFETWPDWLKTALAEDGECGSRLLSENSRVQVWEIGLAPGERWHAHRHLLDCSRQHTHDGTVREVSYQPGETRHFHFGPGEYLLHDIENIGDGEPIFTTVEHLGSANAPLPTAA